MVVETRTKISTRSVLVVMCAGMFLVLLDVTIVNVALPDIGQGLKADVPSLQWVVDGYAVAIAGLLLAAGTAGDRWGHRRVLLAGFGVFDVASLLCAAAPTIGVLVAARVLQGIGGALLLPTTMAVIAGVFRDPAEQARALGIWAAASSLALPAGPLLGGLLVGSTSWRMVFWISVPLAGLAMLGAVRVVPRSADEEAARQPFDAAGLACLVVGLTLVVFSVITAGRGNGVWLPAVGGAAAFVALATGLRVERRAPHPTLPVDLLRRPAFFSPNVVALTMNMIFNGLLFVTMLYLQDVRGYSPLVAGTLVLPLAVPLVALAPVSGRLTARRGPRTAVAVGCLIAAAGCLPLVALQRSSPIALLLAAYLVLGCGAGLVTASVVAAAVRATPRDRPGLATGVSNTARQTGTALGVAIFGAVAGPTGAFGPFVAGVRVLAAAGAVLWVGAFIVTALGVEGAPRTSVG